MAANSQRVHEEVRGQQRRRVAKGSVVGALMCVALLAVVFLIVKLHAHPGIDVGLQHRFSGHEAPELLRRIDDAVEKIGSTKGSFFLVVVIGGWSWFWGRNLRPGVVLGAALTGTGATVALIKWLQERSIPVHAAEGLVTGRAFPSAHTADLVALLGTLILIVEMSRRHRRWELALVIAASLILVATMAFALMDGGFHWFTDILGGALAAGIWVCALTFPAYLLWSDPRLSSALGPKGAPRGRYLRRRREP